MKMIFLSGCNITKGWSHEGDLFFFIWVQGNKEGWSHENDLLSEFKVTKG